MENIKNEKGISMMILTITIIIMLILAGITIAISVGEDGVLEQTGQTAVKVRKSEMKSVIETFSLKYFESHEYTEKDKKEYTTDAGAKVKFYFEEEKLKVDFTENGNTSTFEVNTNTGKLEE